jgi:amidase
MSDSESDIGAFCPQGRFRIEGAKRGPLAGLDFAAKDLIDIAGFRTGAGNPRWLETHAPAAATAPCVQKLLDAGAALVGKTITDELAYSLNGDNLHYGTPRNVNAPGRVPGGSSSGSAAAVAAGLCDFALGTDTGGSVRIPASYCGVFGIRTTHSRIAMEGIVPLMPTLDTLGWFARTPELLAAIGSVLLPAAPPRPPLDRLLVLDTSALVPSTVVDALSPAVARLAEGFASVGIPAITPDHLEAWRQTFRQFSAAEAWSTHSPWIETAKPNLAPAIRSRFDWARRLPAASAEAARQDRGRLRTHIREIIGTDGVLCLPSAAGPAPRLAASEEEVEQARRGAQRLTCVAGIAGLPEVSIPAGRVDGAPVGLSLIGPAGSDEQLLALCRLADCRPYFSPLRRRM